MKKVFQSDFVGFDERGSRVLVYELTESDYEDLVGMTHEEMCNELGVVDESLYPYSVPPGAMYSSYDFSISTGYLVMIEYCSYNV